MWNELHKFEHRRAFRARSAVQGLSDFDVKSNLSVNAIYTVPGPKHAYRTVAGLGLPDWRNWTFGHRSAVHSSGHGDAVVSKCKHLLLSDRIYTGQVQRNPVNKGNVINYLNTACFAFPQGIPNTSTTRRRKTEPLRRSLLLPQFGNEQRNSIIGPASTTSICCL